MGGFGGILGVHSRISLLGLFMRTEDVFMGNCVQLHVCVFFHSAMPMQPL